MPGATGAEGGRKELSPPASRGLAALPHLDSGPVRLWANKDAGFLKHVALGG